VIRFPPWPDLRHVALLRDFPLKEVIVTSDANFAQRQISQPAVEIGDQLFAAKDRPHPQHDIALAFGDARPESPSRSAKPPPDGRTAEALR